MWVSLLWVGTERRRTHLDFYSLTLKVLADLAIRQRKPRPRPPYGSVRVLSCAPSRRRSLELIEWVEKMQAVRHSPHPCPWKAVMEKGAQKTTTTNTTFTSKSFAHF